MNHMLGGNQKQRSLQTLTETFPNLLFPPNFPYFPQIDLKWNLGRSSHADPESIQSVKITILSTARTPGAKRVIQSDFLSTACQALFACYHIPFS